MNCKLHTNLYEFPLSVKTVQYKSICKIVNQLKLYSTHKSIETVHFSDSVEIVQLISYLLKLYISHNLLKLYSFNRLWEIYSFNRYEISCTISTESEKCTVSIDLWVLYSFNWFTILQIDLYWTVFTDSGNSYRFVCSLQFTMLCVYYFKISP